MGRSVALAAPLCILLLSVFMLPARSTFAAGAVEMQVERIVVIAISEYNQAMQAGDPADWLKYFTDNVRRKDPLSSQQGKQAFADYYAREFKTFQVQWATKKMIISGRSAAVEFELNGVHKASGTPVKADAVAILELASSGKFESIHYYFDTAKIGKYLADDAIAAE
jgi:hypothetical protein